MTDIYLAAKKKKERNTKSSSGFLDKVMEKLSGMLKKNNEKKVKRKVKKDKFKKPAEELLDAEDKHQGANAEETEESEQTYEPQNEIDEQEENGKETKEKKNFFSFAKKDKKKRVVPKKRGDNKQKKEGSKKKKNLYILFGVIIALFAIAYIAQKKQTKTIPLKENKAAQKTALQQQKMGTLGVKNKSIPKMDQALIRAKKEFGSYLIGKNIVIALANGKLFLKINNLPYGEGDIVYDTGSENIRVSRFNLECGRSLEDTKVVAEFGYDHKLVTRRSEKLKNKHPIYYLDGIELDNDYTGKKDFYYAGDTIIKGLKLEKIVPVSEDMAKFIFNCKGRKIVETRRVEE